MTTTPPKPLGVKNAATTGAKERTTWIAFAAKYGMQFQHSVGDQGFFKTKTTPPRNLIIQKHQRDQFMVGTRTDVPGTLVRRMKSGTLHQADPFVGTPPVPVVVPKGPGHAPVPSAKPK